MEKRVLGMEINGRVASAEATRVINHHVATCPLCTKVLGSGVGVPCSGFDHLMEMIARGC